MKKIHIVSAKAGNFLLAERAYYDYNKAFRCRLDMEDNIPEADNFGITTLEIYDAEDESTGST